jgi:two-component system OmpR family response regulator
MSANRPPQAAPSGRMRVVLVDDSEIALELVRGMFEDVGAEVHTVAADASRSAAAGAIGLSGALRRVRPDVVVLDMNMPAIRGDEAVVTARRMCPGATIFLFSDDRQAYDCARANGVTWVNKSKPEQLVEEALRRRGSTENRIEGIRR